MDDSETEAWTQVNLQQLLATMKSTLPGHVRNLSYITAQKTVDWNKVAFPPFSPEACQEKWKQILRKLSKTRSLIELIDQANGVITNPVKKVKIHPECPKRPAPPTAIFFEENGSDYQKKHPDRTRQHLLMKLSKKYKGLSCEEKAPYEEKFQLANEEYMRKMQVFSKKYLKGDLRRSKLKKLDVKTKVQISKDAEGMPPKPTVNGYTLFCKEQAASGTACRSVNVWAQSWRDMTEEQKDDYSTRCQQLKRLYVVELKEYLKNFDEETQKRIIKETGIKRPTWLKDFNRRIQHKIPGEPKITFRSGCDIFRRKQMILLKDQILSSKERFGRINKMWLGLSSEEKRSYHKEVFKDNRKYSIELQEWFQTLSAAQQKLYRRHNPSKRQYLDADQMDVYESGTCAPSDSEDEDTEESEDEESNVESDEEDEEEEDDVIVFEMY